MNLRQFKVADLFKPHTGDYHATKELEPGDVPLISCGDANNGLVGYYDIPEKNQYSDTITVAYNGQPLTAKFHPYSFGAKDDVAVLLPRIDMDVKTLIYIAAVFNKKRWRYSYGRKCFKNKMHTLSIPLPAAEGGDLDQKAINKVLSSVGATLPEKSGQDDTTISKPERWKESRLGDLFYEFQHGDFNVLPDEPGDMPTVSRTSTNNGVVGYYKPPEGAEIYEPPKVTVSTVSGKAFVQTNPFIASDKVVILTPKKSMSLASIYFLQVMIDYQAWRYSYGRSCFKSKLSSVEIYVPVDASGKLDQGYMESVLHSTSYWHHLERSAESGSYDEAGGQDYLVAAETGSATTS